MSMEHVVDIDIRWGDADAFGHVNNVEFFRYLEEARARVIPDSGPGSTILSGGLVVAEQQLKYLAPLHYRKDPIQVGMSVDTWEARRFASPAGSLMPRAAPYSLRALWHW